MSFSSEITCCRLFLFGSLTSRYLSVSLLLSASAVIFNLWLRAQSSKKGLCHNRLVLGDCSTQKRANARRYIGSSRLFRGDATENRLFVISGWGVNCDCSVHINTLHQQQPNPTTFVCSVIVVLKAPKSLNIIPTWQDIEAFICTFFSFSSFSRANWFIF